MGTPVGQAFVVESGEAGEPMRHAIAVIDSLHGDGVIAPLVAKRAMLQGLNGEFRANEGIFINTHSRIPYYTTLHEIGHALDFFGFLAGRYESLNGYEITPVVDAYRTSIAYRELQSLRAQLSTPQVDERREENRQFELGRVNYLLRREEVWSRAYAQWVVTSSQDVKLLEDLNILQREAPYADLFAQWSDEDFVRIASEIERLFARKGWLR